MRQAESCHGLFTNFSNEDGYISRIATWTVLVDNACVHLWQPSYVRDIIKHSTWVRIAFLSGCNHRIASIFYGLKNKTWISIPFKCTASALTLRCEKGEDIFKKRYDAFLYILLSEMHKLISGIHGSLILMMEGKVLVCCSFKGNFRRRTHFCLSSAWSAFPLCTRRIVIPQRFQLQWTSPCWAKRSTVTISVPLVEPSGLSVTIKCLACWTTRAVRYEQFDILHHQGHLVWSV